MFEWLFGKKEDTPESLSNEVFGFFNKFKAIQTRIQKLIDAKETEMSEEKTLHQGNVSDETELHEEKNANEVERHEQVLDDEIDRHRSIVIEFTKDFSVLAKSMVIAKKIVKFADEE